MSTKNRNGESPARSFTSSKTSSSSLSDADRVLLGQTQATIAAMAEQITALNNKVDILLANQQSAVAVEKQNPEFSLFGHLPL